jgi:hypothetical protein
VATTQHPDVQLAQGLGTPGDVEQGEANRLLVADPAHEPQLVGELRGRAQPLLYDRREHAAGIAWMGLPCPGVERRPRHVRAREAETAVDILGLEAAGLVDGDARPAVIARAATHDDVDPLRLPTEEPEAGHLEGAHAGQRGEAHGVEDGDPHQLLTREHVVVHHQAARTLSLPSVCGDLRPDHALREALPDELLDRRDTGLVAQQPDYPRTHVVERGAARRTRPGRLRDLWTDRPVVRRSRRRCDATA